MMQRNGQIIQDISPCFGKGSGLKLSYTIEDAEKAGHLPLLRQGERIETIERLSGTGKGRLSPLASARGAD